MTPSGRYRSDGGPPESRVPSPSHNFCPSERPIRLAKDMCTGVEEKKVEFSLFRNGKRHAAEVIRTLSSSGSVLTEFTTQLFFDQTLLNALTTSVSPHSSRGVPDTTNAQDSIYSSATQLTLTNATTGGGYTASITLGVQTG
jgi:hypothetical protein